MNAYYEIAFQCGEFYREYQAPESCRSLTIGTEDGCDYQIPQSVCKIPFTVRFEPDCLKCRASVVSGAVCFPDDQKQEIVSAEKELCLCVDGTNAHLFGITFRIAFKKKQPKFNLGLELPLHEPVTVGGESSNTICIPDLSLSGDSIQLWRSEDNVLLQSFSASFGIYINGTLQNTSCAIRNNSFISIGGYMLFLKNGYLYVESGDGVSYPQNWNSIDNRYSKSHLNYPCFNKSTRILIKPSTEPIEVLDPPEKAQTKKTNILLQLLPAIGMLALTVVLRGVMGGGGTFVIFSACSMSMGILTSVFSIISERKDTKKSNIEREEKYRQYIERKKEEIAQAQDLERKQLEEIYRCPERSIRDVKEFNPELFDRSREDEDFLRVYLGKGDRLSCRPITCNKREVIEVTDELKQIPEAICEEFKKVHDAPIWSDFAGSNAIGIVGNNQHLYDMMRNITLDICTRQFYNDVKLFFIVNMDYSDNVMWLRWLPHVRNDDLGVRNIVCNDESKTMLFEYLYSIMAQREQAKVSTPNIVVMVFNDDAIKRHPISNYLDKATSLGVTFVFFDKFLERLPDCCDEVITLSPDENVGLLSYRKDMKLTEKFTYTSTDDDTVRLVALRLAPVYCDEVSLEKNLPSSYTFFDCFDAWSAADLPIEENWSHASVAKSLAAPIGINAHGDPECLDIHERAHGPHGLVAGTTGSGKSELLQSYMLAMSVCYPPDKVAFLIIDFKGGGMANQMRDLPHMVGAITNIDGREITRSLKSIKAELKKRQYLFAEADVNKIDDYIALYDAGKVSIALPHLIIVVDEFAELKADQPEFMKELISAARIGRSLGIHLILATQKPAGQVSDQIWSNSRFRLCLKVQTKEDSNEMLKSPLAVEIREPGRAYIQVGNNEIFELFQSGYSGGPSTRAAADKQESFSLAEVSLWGKRKVIYQQKAEKQAESKTQLDAAIDRLREYCEAKGIRKLPGICLPPLPEILDFAAASRLPVADGIRAEIGIYDNPDEQLQDKVVLDLTTSNTMIIGASQTGKTNMLQTILRALTSAYTSEDINIYIMDFGSMILKNFSEFPHVGGVVSASEEERVMNLFKMLNTEIALRKQRMADIGVSSFRAYLEAGYTDLPQIILMIDNYNALKELYLGEEDWLLPICRDGLALGLSVIFTNTQTNGIGFRYFSNFATKLALFCNESSEYSSIFDHCRQTILNIPGRGLVSINKEIQEFQTYLSYPGAKEIDRVNLIRSEGERLAASSQTHRARRIPEVPALLTEEIFESEFRISRKSGYSVPVAVDYESVEAVSLDLLQQNLLTVIGKEGGGKTNIIDVILHHLYLNMFTSPSEVYIIDSIEGKLRGVSDLGIVKRYSLDAADLPEYIEKIYDQCSDRYSEVMHSGQSALDDEPLLLLIVNNNDAAAVLAKDSSATANLKELIGQLKKMRVCLIFTGLENAAVGYSSPELLKLLKEARNICFFDELKNMKFVDIPNAALRRFKKALTIGDAYMIHEDEIRKVKTVKSDRR